MKLEEAPFWAVAFYKYVCIEEPQRFADAHLAFCKSLGIKCRTYVSDEGINGQLSGTPDACRAYMAHLEEDERFRNIDYKIDPCEKPAFSKTHVRYRPEIVASRMPGIDPTVKTGKYLSPSEFKQMKDAENVVLLDVRSNYETTVGRFKNAIVLDLENFRDLPDKLPEIEHLKDAKVITYCTGGIKCEKASAFLLEKGFKDVYQLHGGIIRYAYEEGGEDFDGKLYVFDERVVVDVNKVNPTIISRCKHCRAETARMVNCANVHCNDQFVMCEACGWEYKGTCSAACKAAEDVREYDGSGYYGKPGDLQVKQKQA